MSTDAINGEVIASGREWRMIDLRSAATLSEITRMQARNAEHCNAVSGVMRMPAVVRVSLDQSAPRRSIIRHSRPLAITSPRFALVRQGP